MQEQTISNIERAENRLRRNLEVYQERFEGEKARFVERFNENPTSAIQWYSDNVVSAEVKANAARIILGVVDNPENELTLLEATKRVMDQMKEDLMNQYGGTSSNAYSNANDLYAHRAKADFLRDMQWKLYDLESTVDEERELEDLCENATDTTKYALTEIYGKLINNMVLHVREAEEATSKRDTMANERAASALQRQAKMVEDLAEELGVRMGEI